MHKTLYLSYDGMTDPLGQSQVLPYLCNLDDDREIHLISCEKSTEYHKYSEDIQRVISSKNITWHPLVYHKFPPILSTVWDMWKIQKLASSLITQQSFELVHCRSHLMGIIGKNLKKKFGIPFLFDMRSFFPDERVDGNLWPQSKFIYRLVYKYFKNQEIKMFNLAAHIVVLTNAAKDILSKHIESSKITVIPCCADFHHFDYRSISAEEIEDAREDMQLTKNNFVLTYLGSIGTWYKLNEMLAFFKELKLLKPESIFLILTSGSEDLIYKIAKEYSLTPSDLRIKFIPRKDLPRYLILSDVSIFFIQSTFSKLASSPTKHAELMGLGIPVIANSGIGDTDKIILETHSGSLIDLESIEPFNNLSTKIDKLLMLDKQSIREAGQNIFDLEVGIAAYKSIYLKFSS